MPRYFMHLQRADSLIEDSEGREYRSLGEARDYALLSLRDMLADDMRAGLVDLTPRILIADEAGEMKAIVAASEGLRLEGVGPAAEPELAMLSISPAGA